MKKAFKTTLMLTCLMVNAPVMAQGQSSQNAYQEAHSAMQAEHWSQAIQLFDQAQKEPSLVAAAKYWQAYALYQNNQNAQAKRLLKQLIKNHPDSQWIDDAHVLLHENGDDSQHTVGNPELDEELRLFTLQQLMFNNPEKALPKVYEMLEQAKSKSAKRNAIQLLGLSDNKQVAELLFQFIDQENDTELQQDAIQMLSLRGGSLAQERLLELYRKVNDTDTKAAIIQGFIHHDDSQALNALLKQESDPDLSMLMIRMLGIKGETAALKDRYKQAQGDQRRAILEALALAGDAKYLYYVIDNERDADIRTQAIHSLIMVDDEQMNDYLIRLYEKASGQEEKETIAHVLMGTDTNPSDILRLFRNETNQAGKTALIRTLMAMDAVDELRTTYDQAQDEATKSDILHHLGAMDASQALMDIYRQNPEVIKQQDFFMALGMANGSKHQAFLIDQFKQSNNEIKEAVLQALMMQDNTDAMVELLKAEQDHEVKKMIIRTISISNPDALLDAMDQ